MHRLRALGMHRCGATLTMLAKHLNAATGQKGTKTNIVMIQENGRPEQIFRDEKIFAHAQLVQRALEIDCSDVYSFNQ